MKLFQIHEDDLSELEHLCPQLQEALMRELANAQAAPRLRVQLRCVKEILSNVRWNYGPPEQVEIIPCDEPPQ